jgi:hypothetical protein
MIENQANGSLPRPDGLSVWCHVDDRYRRFASLLDTRVKVALPENSGRLVSSALSQDVEELTLMIDRRRSGRPFRRDASDHSVEDGTVAEPGRSPVRI